MRKWLKSCSHLKYRENSHWYITNPNTGLIKKNSFKSCTANKLSAVILLLLGNVEEVCMHLFCTIYFVPSRGGMHYILIIPLSASTNITSPEVWDAWRDVRENILPYPRQTDYYCQYLKGCSDLSPLFSTTLCIQCTHKKGTLLSFSFLQDFLRS